MSVDSARTAMDSEEAGDFVSVTGVQKGHCILKHASLDKLWASQVVADCSQRHTEVSLVSDWCPNLSFYSLMQPLEVKLTQVPQADSPVYNPNDTYLAVINSDGDNMQASILSYTKASRKVLSTNPTSHLYVLLTSGFRL